MNHVIENTIFAFVLNYGNVVWLEISLKAVPLYSSWDAGIVN